MKKIRKIRVFDKMKKFFNRFFSRVFGKKENLKLAENNRLNEKNNYGIEEPVRGKFKEEIKFEVDPELKRLLRLQEKFENGTISENEISNDDITKLRKLYDEQIAEIKKSTEEWRKKIEKIRKQIKEEKKDDL